MYNFCLDITNEVLYTERMNFQEMWDGIIAYFEASGWSIVIFLAVLVAGVIIVRALCAVIKRIFLRSKMERALAGFVITVIRFALYIVLVFMLAAIINVNMTPLAAAISAILVAIGLALQSSLSNIANGVILISTKPFAIGDYVDIEGTGGTVSSIGLFVTELISPDNKKITLTNSAVMAGTITNFSAKATRRVDMTFPVAHGTDIEKVKASVRKVITAHALILADPEPVVRLHEVGESRLNFVVRVWTAGGNYWAVYWDLNEQILARFKKDGIVVPYNRLDVTVKKEDN